MDIIEGLLTRTSTRAFKPDPVPRETIEKILAAALRSPSYMNTQPWELAVVTGRRLRELSNLLIDLVMKDTPPSSDIPLPPPWPPTLEKRLLDHAVRRAEHIGIDLSDPKTRKELRITNYTFYGAPCVIFLFQERSLGLWSVMDAGIFIQSLLLAAHASGLGVVSQGLLADYPGAVRDFLGTPESKRLLMGISLGTADLTAKINSYRSSRADMGEQVKWYE